MKFLLLNGPNLNMLGKRNPAIYGTITLTEIEQMVSKLGRKLGGHATECRQTNSEGNLIDFIQQAPNHADGIILNAGGYTHTSVALRDAVEIARDLNVPTVEVHLLDIHNRELFRNFSVFSSTPSVVLKQICGKGPEGYLLALQALVTHITAKKV